MTDDFVTELEGASQRLSQKRRSRQLIFGMGLAGLALLTLTWCGTGGVGAVGFVFLLGAVGIVLFLEWDGMRLERALEQVPLDGKRAHFRSGRDGLVFGNPGGLFVESRGRFYKFDGTVDAVRAISYLGESHELSCELNANRAPLRKRRCRSAFSSRATPRRRPGSGSRSSSTRGRSRAGADELHVPGCGARGLSTAAPPRPPGRASPRRSPPSRGRTRRAGR